MNGREDKKSNDLFFVCSLIGYIARKTKNRPVTVVDFLGKETIEKIYELADIYHSDNIDRVSDDLICEKQISIGNFDNIANCEYSVPTHWDIGKVYKRLIIDVSANENCSFVEALIKVYHSHVSDLIEDYNSSFYYDSPPVILETYENNGYPIEED